MLLEASHPLLMLQIKCDQVMATERALRFLPSIGRPSPRMFPISRDLAKLVCATSLTQNVDAKFELCVGTKIFCFSLRT
jgi:hypothetical protein